MIYFEKPEDFIPQYFVAGVYVVSNGEILLLKRSRNDEHDPSVWGVPAGSVKNDTTIIDGALRELNEEAGVSLQEDQLVFGATIYQIFEKTGTHVEFTFFIAMLTTKPEIHLSHEHEDYMWVMNKDLLSFSLQQVEGNKEIFEYCLKNGLL